MNKSQRIEKLERTVRCIADVLGYTISSGGGFLEDSRNCPSLGEILKIIYDELNIGYITLEKNERKTRVMRNISPTSKKK